MDQRIVVDRHAQHFVGVPSEYVLRLRRPPHEAEFAVPLHDREWRVIDVRRQHPVRAPQRFGVVLLLVDVRVDGVDADHIAFAVAIGRVVDAFPALLPIGLPQQFLGRHFLAVQHAIEQRL